MSTRAHIRIESKDDNEVVFLYHHCDGDPDCVGADLKRFIKRVGKYDWDVYEIANKILHGEVTSYSFFSKKYDPDLYYELTSDLHGDEDYLYLIDVDSRKLICYSYNHDDTYEETIAKNKIIEIPEDKE